MMKILWNLSTLIQLLLHSCPLHLGKTNTTWVLPLDLPILLSLLCCHSSVQHSNEISTDQHFCLRPFDRWIMRSYWFRPVRWWTFQPFHIQNLFRMLHYQLLSDVEQNFNLFEVRVLVDLRIRQIIRPKMDGGFHRRRHEHSPYQHICFVCLHWDCWVSCWHSQSLLQELKDLAHVLMGRASHVLELWLWRSLHKLPGASGVRVFSLITLERLQENIEKLKILNKQRRWFHSSREKLPLVRMSASWFLVSTFLVRVLGSKKILSNNQSRATLWVLDTCLIVGLRPLIIILMTASLSSKEMYNRDSPWGECVFVVTWSGLDNCWTFWLPFFSIHQTIYQSFAFFCHFRSWLWNWASHEFPQCHYGWCWQCCWLNVTSITVSQRSRAGNPSMRSPASREMISDSVELCETELCFLHIQLTGTNVLLRKTHKTPHEVDFESSRSPAKSESWKNPIYSAVPCFPHDNIVGNRLCNECMKSILIVVCHMPESILWLILQACLRTTRCQNRPIRDKY